MNIFKLAWKNIWIKPLTSILTLLLFSLGIALMIVLLLINSQVSRQLNNNLADIDLVIGAKGSPMQLILCNMYHIDVPTGNIDIKEIKPFLNPKHPLIQKAVPLSIGDSYQTKRIVGTTHEFASLYSGSLKEGEIWEEDFEVCIGKSVAVETGMTLGSTFSSAHGFDDIAGLVHDHKTPFTVVGIYEKSGSVLDHLILCNTSTIWRVHQHEDETDDNTKDSIVISSIHNHHHEGVFRNEDIAMQEDKQITALLIQFKNHNFQTLNMPRSINENTSMQTASPAFEISRMYSMMGSGTVALRILAMVMGIVSILSIFFSLYSSLDDRKFELALLRVLGAPQKSIFLLILLEGLIISMIGFIAGLILGHVFTEFFANRFSDQFQYSMTGWIWHPKEWLILGTALGIGLIASILPAYKAFKLSLHDTLSSY